MNHVEKIEVGTRFFDLKYACVIFVYLKQFYIIIKIQ